MRHDLCKKYITNDLNAAVANFRLAFLQSARFAHDLCR
jgi:hypothetical protein